MICISRQLVACDLPIVMGILNVTPDSFAVHCASMDEAGVLAACERLVSEGADWVDVGACSTRPDGELVSEEEELRRLDMALSALRGEYPDLLLSVDTFRASVAAYVTDTYHVDVINDVSGGMDEEMAHVVSRAHVPYILTYPKAPDATMLYQLAVQVDRLHRLGVSDVIVDPGLGFCKTLWDNYSCLRRLNELKQLDCPILIGLSRKSMIYQALDITPQEAQNGTTAAHVLAMMNGANILRVHDVKETKQTIEIWKRYCH